LRKAPPLRILYAAGPGDVVGTFEYWRRGQDDPRVTDVAYSAQFFDLCRDLRAEARVVSSHHRRKLVKYGSFHVENRPNRWQHARGARYHLGALGHGVSLLRDALQFRADVVVAMDVPFFVFLPLARLGTAIVPALHSVPWPTGQLEHRPIRHLLSKLTAQLFSDGCAAILSHEGACEEQVRRLTRGRHAPISTFVPIFRRGTFAGLADRMAPRPPFRVLFAGRIEPEKGVFDLVEVARILAAAGRDDIEFEVCGQGSAMAGFVHAVADEGLEARMRIRGHLGQAELRETFARCHAVIVPSRIQEGFPTVVAEATLAGRPLVASALCPAAAFVGGAVATTVRPGDFEGYRDTILRLCDDAKAYEASQHASAAFREQFLDETRGWGAALRSVLQMLAESGASRALSSPVA
jgi:glycosyltransferase involved in cell wall biosynthesis